MAATDCHKVIKYRREEKKFHADFGRAIAQSDNFEDFTSRFYSGRYSETTKVKGYYLSCPLAFLKLLPKTKD